MNLNPVVLHPTNVPCPDWCTKPAGHGYRLDAHTDDDGYSRVHQAVFGRLLSIEVAQVERAASPQGPIDREPVQLHLIAEDPDEPGANSGTPRGPDGHPLTAAHLRRFAAALLAAADLAETLTTAPEADS